MKNFLKILNKRHKFEIQIFTLSSIVFLLLETIGVGLLPVYLTLLDDPSIIADKISFFENIKFDKNILIKLTIFLFLFFLFKNLYFFAHNIFESKLSKNLKFYLSKELLKIYLKKNYLYHLDNNPNILGRNVTSDINASVSYIRSTILIFRETFQILFISVLLMYANLFVSVTVIFFISISIISYYLLLRRKIKNLGIEAWYLRGEKSKIIYQTLNSIVEVLIYKKISYLSSKFENTISKEYRSIFLIEIINKVPKLLLETLIVLLFCLFLIFSFYLNNDFYASLPTLALFTIAAVRIYPSFVNLILHKNARVENKACISQIIKHFNNADKNLNIQKFTDNLTWNTFSDKIEFRNVNFSYKNRNHLLKNINFEIKKNSFVGIVGETGSGKSTLLNLILGLVNVTNGEILIDKIDINKVKSQWQDNVSYVPQNTYLFDDTIKENIVFGDEANEEKILSILKDVELKNFIDNLPNKLNTIVGNEGKKISGGERQRIGIARALYKNKNILVLDEITSNLDTKTENKIMEIIKNLKSKKTIIMISHSLNTINFCDKIFKLEDGKVSSQD